MVVDLPEFGDASIFKPAAIAYWLNYANLLLDPCIWGPSAADPWPTSNPPPLKLFDVGCELVAAHNLTLEAMAQASATNGMPPGLSTGPVNHKQVDKASVGFDTSIGSVEGAGPWNLTTYGTRFILLAQQLGSVPLTIGLPGPAPALSGQPWIGPPPWPGFFG